ncbi:MAG: ferrous iron transport protein A [Desulfurococcales archaeon]|nr:ferrous iron transport protein A [Desulfurococcales archaeon]
MTALSRAPEGARVRVRSVPGGSVGGMLKSRGIMPGSVLTIVSNPSVPWSPVIVKVMGTRVAVGRDVANSIEVEVLSEGEPVS